MRACCNINELIDRRRRNRLLRQDRFGFERQNTDDVWMENAEVGEKFESVPARAMLGQNDIDMGIGQGAGGIFGRTGGQDTVVIFIGQYVGGSGPLRPAARDDEDYSERFPCIVLYQFDNLLSNIPEGDQLLCAGPDYPAIQNWPATVRRIASGSTGCSTRSITPVWHTAAAQFAPGCRKAHREQRNPI